MLNFLKLQVLAILQGLTEFLPVSSSGHLALARSWLGLEQPADAGPVLELLLHVGTLVAVVFYYRRRIAELLSGLARRDAAAWRYAVAIVLSCIPAGVLYFLAHEQIDSAFDRPLLIGGLLMVNGLVMLSLRRAPKLGRPLNLPRALAMGLAQAVAILPGISRSGSTYTCGRWCRTESKDAFDFAFLMSIPTIAGAVLLKVKDFGAVAQMGGGMVAGVLVATVLSAAVGLAALKLLSFLRMSGKMWLFGTYCLALGTIAVIVELFR